MPRALIPAPSSRTKMVLKGQITVWDALWTGVFLAFSVGMAFALSIVGVMGQIVFGVLLFTMLMSLLIPVGKTKTRVYTLFFRWIKFSSGKNKFTKGGTNNSKFLIPYAKVEDNFIKTDKIFLGKSMLIGGLELKGFNLFNKSTEEQDMKIQQFKNMFKFLNCDISLVKLEKPLQLEKNLSHLKSTKEKIKKSNLSALQKNARIEQLDAFIQRHEEENGELSNGQLEKRYYLLIYAYNQKEMKQWLSEAYNKSSVASLNPKILDYYEMVNVIRTVINPLGIDFSKEEIDKNKNDLKQLLAFDKVEFKSDHVKADGSLLKYSSIWDYKKFPNRGWGMPLMSADSSVIMNIKSIKKENLKKTLSKQVTTLEANILNTSKKNMVDIRELEQERDIYYSLIDSVGSGVEEVKKLNTMIINYAYSKKELLQRVKDLDNVLKDDDIVTDPLQFQQFQGYSSSMPKATDPFDLTFSREVPGTAIAEMFPWGSTQLQDENGFYIGTNNFGEPVILDQFKKNSVDKNRKNHNMFIIGTSGSGKSTMAKKIINSHLAENRKVMIIDPEREYKDLTTYYNGKWVDVGNGTNGRINPLQVFTTLQTDDQDSITNDDIISNHIQFLEHFFNILFPDLKDDELRYLSKLLSIYYRDYFKRTRKSISDLPSSRFPTFEDLAKWLTTSKNKTKVADKIVDKALHQKMVDLIVSEFTGYGKYKQLYNGESNIKTNDNPLTVFDINDLFEKGNQKVIQAQLFLITAFMQNEIKINGFNTDNECVVLIDEAHLLIDKDKPIALDFIFQMVKRIRKRKGGVILITQNPDDFLGTDEIKKKTQAIVNNAQYTVIMNLSPANVSDVDQMYHSAGGLTESEQNFIKYAQTGDALIFTTTFDRNEVHVKISDTENKAFKLQVN